MCVYYMTRSGYKMFLDILFTYLFILITLFISLILIYTSGRIRACFYFLTGRVRGIPQDGERGGIDKKNTLIIL